jgi:hypothetical protein
LPITPAIFSSKKSSSSEKYSSFHRFVERGDFLLDWGGDMHALSSGAFGE